MTKSLSLLVWAIVWVPPLASANVAGGGTGQGPDVTVVDQHGTVTVANGIVSIVIDTKKARLDRVAYTHNNSSSERISDVLLPAAKGRGQYYYGGVSLGSGAFDYALATDPASNGGAYADVRLLSDSEHNGVMEVHFSMLRGSPGFYSTAIMTHRKQDLKFEVGAWGVVTRVTPIFNWLSADAARNWFVGDRSKLGVKVPDSPHEISVLLDGSQQGEYADKFIYSQDHADLHAWGWSSVGPKGLNIGAWMMTEMEFSNGGPLKRDVSVYPYSELNNSILTGEVGMGSDGFLGDGEEWTKTCGPWFMYYNEIPATVTNARQAANLLYQDALAQAEAEKNAWPYSWFSHPSFVPASGRGTVTGRFVINDIGNPNASAAAIWVGLVRQPQTNKGFYDFQKWLRPYQFWAQTNKDGSFTIPHVIAGDNYTLWAFGPGAAGTFLSQKLNGGNPPFECNIPEKPFTVTVKAAEAKSLGTLAWTPVRVGPTVFELGTPDRKASEFRHGEDYWAPGKSPKLGFPTPVWGGQMEFPLDFPDGMHYTVGKSQWTTDWNYVLPAAVDPTGSYQPCTGTITFDLAKVPANGVQASLYLAFAGNDGDKVIVIINGTKLGAVPGVTATPNVIAPTGFAPSYSDTSSIHFSDHGPFCDERIAFPTGLLRVGKNTVAITMDSRKLVSFLMLDYLRLELPGYVPPAPRQVIAYAGNHRNLIRWPVVPGATSYNIFRSTSRDSGYAPIAVGIVAPVCGSGTRTTTLTDTAAANGTQYFYAVQAVNPVGQSTHSSPSVGVAPSPGLAAIAPAAPDNLQVTSSGHHKVALSWIAAPRASYYTVWRTTLHTDGVGGTYPLRTTLIEDGTTETSDTDESPSDGTIYRYQVTAVNAFGSSRPSSEVTGVPLPSPPAAAPLSLTGNWRNTRNGDCITLSWQAVPGATGYVIYRSTGADPSFKWPSNFLTALVETTFTDRGNTETNAKVKGLTNRDYSYQVTAVNAAGTSQPATIHVPAH